MSLKSSGEVDLKQAGESIGRIRQLETWLPATGAMIVQGLLPDLNPESSNVPDSARLLTNQAPATAEKIQKARRLLEQYLDWKMLEHVDPDDPQERARIRLAPVRAVEFLIDCDEILEGQDPGMLWEFLAIPGEERGFLSLAAAQVAEVDELRAKLNPQRITKQGNRTPIAELIERARNAVGEDLRYCNSTVYNACLNIILSAKGERLPYLPHLEFGVNGDEFFYKLPPLIVKNVYSRSNLKKYLDRRRGKGT